MALDATGTPTALGIPKYNTAADPPSGKGFNAAMDALDTLLAARLLTDAVTVAGTRVLATKLLTGDANQAFRIMGDGKLEWGAGGASAPDVNLYRSAANMLKTDDAFVAAGSVSADGVLLTGASSYFGARSQTADATIFASRATGQAADRFTINNAGTLRWGDGTAAPDVILYRNLANSLRTDDSFYVGGGATFSPNNFAAGGRHDFHTTTRYNSSATGQSILEVLVSGENAYRFQLNSTGIALWGDGTNPADVNLYRSAVNELRTDDAFVGAGGLKTGDLSLSGSTMAALTGNLTLSAPSGSQIIASTGDRHVFHLGGTATFAAAPNNAGFLMQNSGGAVATPAGGGFLYVESGALKFKGSSGTVTTIAIA